MGPNLPRPDSSPEPADAPLFRTAARLSLPAFGVVLVAGLFEGDDPSFAVLRALAALLVVAGCGWVGERLIAALPASRRGSTRDGGA